MTAPALISRPALRYYGGKWRLADWIISHFPPHDSYVEPFAGAASVLLRKVPSRIEVYNDLDREVVEFFRVLRDRGEQLSRAISLTPYSLEEFNRAFEPSDDDLERARRFFIRSWQGHGGRRRNRTGWRREIRRREEGPIARRALVRVALVEPNDDRVLAREGSDRALRHAGNALLLRSPLRLLDAFHPMAGQGLRARNVGRRSPRSRRAAPQRVRHGRAQRLPVAALRAALRRMADWSRAPLAPTGARSVPSALRRSGFRRPCPARERQGRLSERAS